MSAVRKCPACGWEEMAWAFTPVSTTGVADGRLRMSEVDGLFILFCEECSETVETVPADAVAEHLSKSGWTGPRLDT